MPEGILSSPSDTGASFEDTSGGFSVGGPRVADAS